MASLAQMKREAEAQSMKALQDRREQTRQDFFKGREDISPDRLDRRQIQAELLEKFKKEQMKPVAGSSNLLQSVRPGGPTTADEAMRLARMYGPTLKEIGSDIGYGIKSIGSALGQKFAAGEIGIMGIAKGLFEKFSNAVNASKKAIGDQVNKLSDIDLEILKNKDKYKFTSKKPDLVNIDQLEANAQQAAANRDYFGTYFSYGGPSMPGEVERQTIKPIIPSTLYGMPQQPPGFKVMPPEQKALLEEMNKAKSFSSGISTIQNQPNEKDYLQQQDDYYYQDKERFSPQGNPYLYAANGGAVDQKLNNLQKKTNNIYGTGILSVR